MTKRNPAGDFTPLPSAASMWSRSKVSLSPHRQAPSVLGVLLWHSPVDGNQMRIESVFSFPLFGTSSFHLRWVSSNCCPEGRRGSSERLAQR
ncbi:unnamed protein product [Lota lota]